MGQSPKCKLALGKVRS